MRGYRRMDLLVIDFEWILCQLLINPVTYVWKSLNCFINHKEKAFVSIRARLKYFLHNHIMRKTFQEFYIVEYRLSKVKILDKKS
jgi:hypothetical protein